MADIVIREVTKDVWTFSCPFSRFGFVPIGGRSTAIRLASHQNGSKFGVWVLASTPLTQETKQKLNELGDVRFIVGPDSVHNLYLSEYKKEYPQAKVIGVDDHLSKTHLKDLKFDGVYGKDPAGTKYGFEDEIEACFFSGFVNKDVAFNHKPSKSLIVADLLFNLPPREQYSKSNQMSQLPVIGNLTPFTWFHKRFLWNAGKDKEAMKKDAKTVAGWDFERIIPCHGDVIERDAKKAWLEAYAWYL